MYDNDQIMKPTLYQITTNNESTLSTLTVLLDIHITTQKNITSIEKKKYREVTQNIAKWK